MIQRSDCRLRIIHEVSATRTEVADFNCTAGASLLTRGTRFFRRNAAIDEQRSTQMRGTSDFRRRA